MVWPPAATKLVVNVAMLPAPTATVPRTTLPSWNVTVPVGVPAPGATADTVAVKVTAWPATPGLTDDRKATVVDARLTVSVTTAEVLAAKPGTPKKSAVSAWVPMPSDTGTVAWPAPSSGSKPRTVLPSRKATKPIGVPAWELTVAVSENICPKTAVGADVLSVVVVAAAGTGVAEFNTTPTVLEKVLAATRSTRPSPLKSAAATLRGSLPPVETLCSTNAGNVPSPFPLNTVSPSGMAASPPTAASSRPSLLKSPRATSPSLPVAGLWRRGAWNVPSPLPSSTPS